MTTPPPTQTSRKPWPVFAWVAAVVILIAAAVVVAVIRTPARLWLSDLFQQPQTAAFYKLPNPLPEAKPGIIMRTERLDAAPNGTEAWRVLYHSTDLNGKNILVSGMIVAPAGPAPAGGRPVVSWGHPTTGIAPKCAPSVSNDPYVLMEGLNEFIKAGYVVVATDYSGLGADGPDSFLIGATEGHNMLDIVRAARNFPQAHAGDQVLLWGHSQGGHAALFAGQLAPEYAPELKLKAVATAAPATNLSALIKDDIDDISGVSIGSYAFTTYAAVYDSVPGTALSEVLTRAGAAAAPDMAKLCLLTQNAELHKLADPLVGHFLGVDPATALPWSELLSHNSPGQVPLTVPLFIAQGQNDKLVHPDVTTTFAETETHLGTTVTYEVIPNTGHGEVANRAMPKLMEWLKTLPQ